MGDSATTGKTLGALGTVALVLSNLADILEYLRRIADVLRDFLVFTIPLPRVFLWGVAIGGYCAVGVALYLWMKKRWPDHQRVAIVAVTVCLAVLALANLTWARSATTPAAAWQPLTETMVTRLRAASVPGDQGGGFVIDPGVPYPSGRRQTWTTAQAIVALLEAQPISPDDAQRIRNGFKYIETTHIDGGYAYWADQTKTAASSDCSSPVWAVTDVTAWVVIAYARAFHANVWPNAEDRQAALERIERDSKDLNSRQTDGGFSPVPEVADKATRTYSTAVALWALVERRSLPGISDAGAYDSTIVAGTHWLLSKWDDQVGWLVNPSRGDKRERFPGLTAEVLFVLTSVQRASASLIAEPAALDRIKARFVESRFGMGDRLEMNTRTPDMDIYIGSRVVEGSTFLWYPWSLATLSRLADDPKLDASVRRAAQSQRTTLLSMDHEMRPHLDLAATYELSEILFGVSEALRR